MFKNMVDTPFSLLRQYLLHMAEHSPRIDTSAFRVRRVVGGHGLPVQPVSTDLLSQNPHPDSDVGGRFQYLIQRPAVFSDPAGVDLHQSHVERAAAAQGGPRQTQSLFFGVRPYIPSGDVQDPGPATGFCTGNGQSQSFRHLIAGARRIKEMFHGLLTFPQGVGVNRAADERQKNQERAGLAKALIQ